MRCSSRDKLQRIAGIGAAVPEPEALRVRHGEWRDGQTSFATVNCWRGLASNAAASFRKGHPILVTGRLQVREIDKGEGKRRTVVDIEADTIGHDLFRGVGVFSRLQPQPGVRDEVARGEAIRAGQEPESGQGMPGLPPADSEMAGVPDDLIDARAVGEFADALGEPATAAAPF